MTTRKRCSAGKSAPSAPDFEPVKLRYRRDGLTPERQVALIQTMAACGCIREACAKVGISPEAVYELRRRPDAQSFRLAMDLALDGAADKVEDAMYGRAINGVEIPHYYKGELVGTHRRYDERLAMFILRYRKPYRYGKHLDRRDQPRHPERVALGMADTLAWVAADAWRDGAGQRRQVVTELAQDGDEEPWNSTHLYRWGPAFGAPPEEEEIDDDGDFDLGEEAFPPDVPSTSSTSGRRQGFGRQAGTGSGQAKAARRSSEGAQEGSARNRRMRRKAAAKARKR